MKKLMILWKKKRKTLFSIGFILLGILFVVFLLIKQPKTLSSINLYEENDDFNLETVSFPLIQKIEMNVDFVNAVTLNLGDNSINDFEYQIQVLDQDKNVYFEQSFIDYPGNTYYLYFGEAKVDELIVKINCEECINVKMNVAKVAHEVSLNGEKSKSLKMGINSYNVDYQYYWYAIMLIVFGFTLLLFARSEENEK